MLYSEGWIRSTYRKRNRFEVGKELAIKSWLKLGAFFGAINIYEWRVSVDIGAWSSGLYIISPLYIPSWPGPLDLQSCISHGASRADNYPGLPP
jgi:hypothetical protein